MPAERLSMTSQTPLVELGHDEEDVQKPINRDQRSMASSRQGCKTLHKQETSSKDGVMAKARDRRISMSQWFFPSTQRLTIIIQQNEQNAIVKVAMFDWSPDGRPARAECKIASTTFEKTWDTIVTASGLTLADSLLDICDGVKTRLELSWSDGHNEFVGFELHSQEPYKTIVEAIEEMAESALDEVYGKEYRKK